MVERPILSESYEQLALDIDGLLPQAKDGVRYEPVKAKNNLRVKM